MAAADYTSLVQQIYISYFGRPADSLALANYTARLDTLGAPTTLSELITAAETDTTLATIINGFGNSTESIALYGTDTITFVKAVFNNVLNRDPLVEGLLYWAGKINSGEITKANAALIIAQGALANETEQGLIDAAVLTNKTAVAVAFTASIDTVGELTAYSGATAAAAARAMLQTVTNETVAADFQETIDTTLNQMQEPVVVVVEPMSFNLTDAANVGSSFTGGTGNDTFTGSVGTIEGDSLTGGTGTDTLSLTVNDDDDGASFTTSGIEVISVRVASSATGAVELDMATADGVTTINASRLAQTLTLTDVQAIPTVSIDRNSTAAILDVNFEADVVSGSSDAMTVNLTNSTDAEIDADGIETVTLVASSAPTDGTNVIDISGDDMETVNVTATGKLTVRVDDATTVSVAGTGDVSVTVAAAADSTVTGATLNGKLTVTANGAADLTLTGGAGNDTFSMSTTLTADDVIAGGAGTDTLKVTGAGGAIIPSSAQITAVETLTITTGGADTLNATRVAFDNINVITGNAAHTITMTNVTDEVIKISDTDGSATAIDDIAISLADATGDADSLTLTITSNDDTTALTVDDISTGAGVETLNLVLNAGEDLDDEDINIDAITATVPDTLNISGDADVIFGTDTAIDVAEIVSTSTGDLTFELGAATHDITLGAGDDSVDFNATMTTADEIDTGAGDDTVSAQLAASAVTAATIANAETLVLDFANTGSTFSGANTTGATAITIADVSDENATLTNLKATVATVTVAATAFAADNASITYVTGASSAHSVVIGDIDEAADVDVGTLTVARNAGALSVLSNGFAGNSVATFAANTAASVAVTTELGLEVTTGFSASNATAFTVTTDGGDFDVSGALAVTLTDATTITLNALDGDILVDNAAGSILSDADVVVSMTADGSGNDITIDTLDVDNASAVSMVATDGATVSVTDDLIITGENDDGDDINVVVTLNAAGADSTVTVANVSAAAATELDKVVLISSDDGVVSFTASDDDLTITEIDATGAAADDVVINVSDLGAATEINLGAGDATVTTSDNGDTVNAGSGDLTLTLTAGASEVNMAGGDATITVTAGAVTLNLAAGEETIQFSDINDEAIINDFTVDEGGDILNISTTTFASENGSGTAVTSALVVNMQSAAGGAAFTLSANTNILVLTGTYADEDAVEAALEGDMTTGAGVADGHDLLVIYTDGADAYMALVDLTDVTSGAVVTTVGITEHTVKLVGVSVSDLTADNFAFVA